jgi:superfamily II DNA/RNA helicase
LDITTFAGLGLSAKVLAAIEASGYTTPTPIQSQAIPVAVGGRDILGIAQTGTGKTAAFVMPMITRLETGRARARMPRSLILAPTRELAAQVAQSFEKYGQNHKLSLALLIGGVSMDDQTAKLDRGVDVLIATPGRLLDHFQRGRVMLMGVEILVIDEADRMLDMGFIPDIEKICKLLPPKRQTLFFSATMPPEITRLVDQFLTNPERIEVAKPATTAKTITQLFRYASDGEDYAKREILRDMIRAENVKNAIIFCNHKRDVAILLKSLLKHGFNAGALHGDMDQMSRTATLDKFRSGEITFLAASDVAARGLDIPDVSHIFNFDVPWQADDYVHRIGRTGRAGREGISATIVTIDDLKAVQEIEKLTGEPAVWIGEPPSAEDTADGARRKRGRGRGRPGAGRGGERGGRSGGGDRGRRDGGRERGGEGRPPRDRERARAHDQTSIVAGDPVAVAAVEGAAPEAERAERPAHRQEPRRDRDRRPERRRERPQRAEGDAPAPEHHVEQLDTRDHAPVEDQRPRQDQRRDAPRRDQPRRQPRQDQPRGEPREDLPRREPRRERDAQPQPQAQPRQRDESRPRPDRSERRPEGQRRDGNREGGPRESGPREGGEKPIGFGESLPAFMRRPAKASS